jgi:CRP-like cAMP-binding protein
MSDNLSQIESQVGPKVPPPIAERSFSAIGGNRLLAALPAADFELLAPYLSKARFAQGSVLQEPGEPVTRVYFLERGLVSLLALTPEGPAIDTGSIGRDGAIGLIAGLGAHTALTRAVVHVPVSAAQIPVTRLAQAASRSEPIRDMIVRYTDGLLEQTLKLAVCNTVHAVSQRLCRWLLQAHRHTGDNTLPLTQACLADMLGVQRTTVTAIGRALQAAGIIKVRRGRIQILDVDALECRACTCHQHGRQVGERLVEPAKIDGGALPDIGAHDGRLNSRTSSG